MSKFTNMWEGLCFEHGTEEFITLAPQFEKMWENLCDFNSHTNITAITDAEDTAVLHFLDSLTVSAIIPTDSEVLDVGCGGGFPSLPLALARPDIKVTSLDSTAKKLKFVDFCADSLGLKNITSICQRAEDLSEFREKFDVVTARGVASLDKLCEICIPSVKVGGKFIAMKAKSAEEELKSAGTGYKKLGCDEPTVKKVFLSNKDELLTRCLISYRKKAPTPSEYPRSWAKISKNPLR